MANIQWSGPFVPINGSNLISEDLTSQVDGITSTFSTSEAFQSVRLFVFLNGLFQGPPNGTEVTINSTISFTLSTTPQVGDILTVIYSPQ